MLEAYTTLGYLAAHTSRVKLLTLVTGVVYRQPGLLAKIVTTLDVLSGGRAMLGIGAAWNEEEARGLGPLLPADRGEIRAPGGCAAGSACRCGAATTGRSPAPTRGWSAPSTRPRRSAGPTRRSSSAAPESARRCAWWPATPRPATSSPGPTSTTSSTCSASTARPRAATTTRSRRPSLYNFDVGEKGERVGEIVERAARPAPARLRGRPRPGHRRLEDHPARDHRPGGAARGRGALSRRPDRRRPWRDRGRSGGGRDRPCPAATPSSPGRNRTTPPPASPRRSRPAGWSGRRPRSRTRRWPGPPPPREPMACSGLSVNDRGGGRGPDHQAEHQQDPHHRHRHGRGQGDHQQEAGLDASCPHPTRLRHLGGDRGQQQRAVEDRDGRMQAEAESGHRQQVVGGHAEHLAEEQRVDRLPRTRR